VTGLRAKIVLIATSALLLAIGAILASTGYFFEREYSQALESRSVVIAKNLKVQLERILQLGIRLEDLSGFDEQAQEIVRTYPGIDYALVVDTEGRVLFSSQAAPIAGAIADARLLDALPTGREVVVPPSARSAGEYNAVVPVLDRGRPIAGIVVGFPERLISAEVNTLWRLGLAAGLAAMALGIAVLLVAVGVFVTGPIGRLVAAIERIRESQDLSLRVPGRARGEIGVLIANFNAMLEETEQRALAKREADAQLQHRAAHDLLTGLPNRTVLHDRLEQLLAQSRRTGQQLGVMFIDLDQFKFINDSFGHAVGDALLKAVGRRLVESVRESDAVTRLGGDEFAVILANLSAPHDAARVAQKIVDAMTAPFRLDSHEMFVTASVGIAIYPQDAADGETLLKNADAAMFRAKELGRNGFQFYTAAMNARAREKLLLENDLRHALERGELALHFQPKASLAGGYVTGFEALLRWHRTNNGAVSPAEFVPVLERSGLIVPVGEWVIDRACAQLRAWRDAGLEPVPIAINLSVRQFMRGDISATIVRALAEHDVEARLLEVEITESDAMRNPAEVAETLGRLRMRGLRISIDDFGTGYSSLAYLKRLPVDALKIDRSFVAGLPGNGEDASIARAVIGMAHSLGLKVIAEGVENAAQRDFLATHGCDEIQGYLLSRPAPATECTRLLHVRAEAQPQSESLAAA